ncbi:MAG: helix-turn-helix domain-containing protein [Acutalibacteraceae bacterium]
MTFFETLTMLMHNNKSNAKQLSETLQIGKNQFKYWKDKGNIPNGETLIALADYFHVSVDYLLGREKEKTSINESCCSSETDEQQKKLIDNYNKINAPAKKALVQYSDFIASQPDNLKDITENSQPIS